MIRLISNKFKKILFILSVLFSISGCEEEIIGRIYPGQELRDLRYGFYPNQSFDLYLPEERSISTTRTIILVHGGGWIDGDKKDIEPLISELALKLPGYAFANLNYRLLPGQNVFNNQIVDIATAVQFMQYNSQEYLINNEFAIIGVDAGAHLALLYSYTYGLNDISIVCSIAGVTNFTDVAYTDPQTPELKEYWDLIQTRITRLDYVDEPVFYSQSSPLFQANQVVPKTMLFYGGNDPIIPPTQGTQLNQVLETYEIDKLFTYYPDAGHDMLNNQEYTTDIIEKIVNFFQDEF